MARKALVGLDLGHKNIRAVAVRPMRDGCRVTAHGTGESKIEGNGEAENGNAEPAIGEVLRELWKSSRLGNKHVVMGTTRMRTVTRRVSFPPMPRQDLEKVVGIEAERHLPIESGNLVYDYSLSEGEAEGDNVQVVLVGTARSSMYGLIETARKAKLNPVAVDVSPVAAYRALAHPSLQIDGIPDGEGIRDPNPEHAYILIDLGYDESRVSIFINGTPMLSRTMPVGGRPITHSLARAAGIEPKQAEELKRKHGIAKQSFASSPLYGHVEPVLQQLARQILQSLQFFSGDNRETDIAHVYLHGGAAAMPGLDVFLHEFLHEHGSGTINWRDDEPAIDCVGDIRSNDQSLPGTKYLTAAGLALWGVVQ